VKKILKNWKVEGLGGHHNASQDVQERNANWEALDTEDDE